MADCQTVELRGSNMIFLYKITNQLAHNTLGWCPSKTGCYFQQKFSNMLHFSAESVRKQDVDLNITTGMLPDTLLRPLCVKTSVCVGKGAWTASDPRNAGPEDLMWPQPQSGAATDGLTGWLTSPKAATLASLGLIGQSRYSGLIGQSRYSVETPPLILFCLSNSFLSCLPFTLLSHLWMD